ncbi:MAG: UvrD-helicase domain-containing protein [Candidatus Nanoarchaeia archaeon]
MEFNSDGSIKVPEILKNKKRLADHVKVLALLQEMPFSAGKKFLAEILKGEQTQRIKKLRLNRLDGFCALELYEYKDIYELIEKMKIRGLIRVNQCRASRFLPVIECTKKGIDELENGGEEKEIHADYEINEVTERDKKLFFHFGEFLKGFNDEQKKSIIEPARNILCIAGAGSGKTTVLTKRIEFLAKCRSVDTSKILAITFTRKARQEMVERIFQKIPGHSVQVETFNSFSEKILKQHGDKIYDKDFRVMGFSDKIKLYKEALEKNGYGIREALKAYYPPKKLKSGNEKKLFFDMVFQVSSLLENCKNNNTLTELREKARNLDTAKEKNRAIFIISLIEKIEELKKEYGLRDYTDQLRDALNLFKKKPALIPLYEHILVDEYQDVNELQVKIIEQLSPKNLFAVGDPRQSIYGWRGSRIEYIMNFDYPYAKVLQLRKNYRSDSWIVESSNKLIKTMGLPYIKPHNEQENKITLLRHNDEKEQAFFIAKSILSLNTKRKEIFILARTNKQLETMAEALEREKINYLKKTEEMNQETEARENQVTLSTVHAIKGLEAEVVYLIGVNSNMYPCLVSEDNVIETLKAADYDKYAEEQRLLYVAMTRAKKRLVVNYFNSLSPFITKDVKKDFEIVLNGKSAQRPEDKLKQWYSQKIISKEHNSLCEKTLQEIIKNKPKNYDDLLQIKGITETQVDKFGDEILDIINHI